MLRRESIVTEEGFLKLEATVINRNIHVTEPSFPIQRGVRRTEDLHRRASLSYRRTEEIIIIIVSALVI